MLIYEPRRDFLYSDGTEVVAGLEHGVVSWARDFSRSLLVGGVHWNASHDIFSDVVSLCLGDHRVGDEVLVEVVQFQKYVVENNGVEHAFAA